jgi:hypothetical protein
MEKIKTILSTFILVGFSVCLTIPNFGRAQSQTPDNWKCENKVKGSWHFGVAPSGCDARVFGEDSYVWDTYLPVVFNEQRPTSKERNHYMEELAAILREAAARYIKKRKPEVSAAESTGFVRAILTMAHQESYWTHYRQHTDNRLKMMRGDNGHGHGMMQIDDRWHFVEINKGVGWSLVDNLVASFEEYFSGWEKAPKSKCLADATNFRARARAAYSAYNGGSSKICRWTNPSDTWAANDKGFIDKYDNQLWQKYIEYPKELSTVNVECLIEGQESCPLRNNPVDPGGPQEGKIYTTSRQQHCIFKEGNFYCIENSRDLACLQVWSGGPGTEVSPMTDQMEREEIRQVLDRHELCVTQTGVRLHAVGVTLKTNREIQMRATPAGNPVVVVPTGQTLQIYDFELRKPQEGKRYYQVSWQGHAGFIYAGNNQDFDQWTNRVNNNLNGALIANRGQNITVTKSAGITLRETIGGKSLLAVPVETLLVVDQVVVRGEANEIYYRVKFNNKLGFIYAGRSLPQKTFLEWTVPLVK